MKTRVFIIALFLVVALFALAVPNTAAANLPMGGSNNHLTSMVPALQATCVVTQIAPTGTVTTSRPVFQWSFTGGCTTFYIWSVGTVINQATVTNAAPACVGGVCTFTPTWTYGNGSFSWYVFGFPGGTWIGPTTFDVTVTTPVGFTSPPWTGWAGTSGSWFTIGTAPNQQFFTAGVPGQFASAAYTPTSFTDLDYQVQLLRYGCPWCAFGIDVRGVTGAPDGGWLNAYQFEINRNGYFSVWRGVNDTWTALQYWTYSPAIRRGNAWNTLRVINVGSSLYFFINGTLVWAGTDTQLTSGQVGAFIARVGATTTNDSLFLNSASLTVPNLTTASLPNLSADQKTLNADANQKKVGTKAEGPK